MDIAMDTLEQRAKRLRIVQITLQTLLAYLISISIVGLVSWGIVFLRVVRQMPEVLSWEEPEALITLLWVPGQYLVYAFLAGGLLYAISRSTHTVSSIWYRFSMVLLLVFMIAQLVMGTISALELGAIRPSQLPWAVVTGAAAAYLAALVAGALIAAWRLSPAEQRMVDTLNPPAFFSWRGVKRSLGIPEIVDFMRRRRRLVALLFFLAACGSAYLPAYFSTGHGGHWLQAWSLGFYCARAETGPDCMQKLLAQADQQNGLAWFLIQLLLPLLIAVGLLWIARRNVRISVEDLLGSDTRQPLLFLRAFKDDQVPLPSGRQPMLLSLLGLGRIPHNLDEILLEEGTLHGPVVALGNPADPLPPFGVARGYFKHDNWQTAVTRMASDCAAIVLCVDDSEGVWWEVDHIMRESHLQKTLIVLHPRYSAPDANAAILERLSRRLRLSETSTSALIGSTDFPVIFFFFDERGQLQVGRSRRATRMTIILGIRWFLRTRVGSATSRL